MAYEARTWVDRGPIPINDLEDAGIAGPGGFIVLPVLALVNVVLSGLWALLWLPWRLVGKAVRR